MEAKKKETTIQFIKFTLFSISAGAIQLGSYALLYRVLLINMSNENLHEGISYFVALVLSVIWNFTFNRKFTFKSSDSIK